MAVEHMVWFRFRDDVPEPRREQHAAALRRLPEQIPGIERVRVGWNFTQRARGAQLAMIVSLESKPALEGYAVHPAHVAVATALKADCDEILAFDFEA